MALRSSESNGVSAQEVARTEPGVRLLSIDYGRRRIGLAISDALGWTVRPLATIERKGRAADMARLQEVVRQYGVERIIVGHPLRMDGTTGEMAEEAARFARRVGQALHLPVELVDERLTSWAARQWQSGRGETGVGKPKDEIAAAILLEEYLGRGSENGG